MLMEYEDLILIFCLTINLALVFFLIDQYQTNNSTLKSLETLSYQTYYAGKLELYTF